MSQAFVKEEDGQWLHDLPPTISALVNYLTRENNGIRVYEVRSEMSSHGQQLHHMSNGLAYFVDENSQWAIKW